jgi:hypothetical protein
MAKPPIARGEIAEWARELKESEVGIPETMIRFAALRDAGRLDTSDIEAETTAQEKAV